MRRFTRLSVAALLWAVPGDMAFGQGDAPGVSAGFGARIYGLASTGWTIREVEPADQAATVELGSGTGVGVRISYDFSRWIAGYAGAEVTVEQEGPYGSYGLGVLLRPAPGESFRVHALLGARIIDAVTSLVYADLGLGGELFVTPRLALGLDLKTALPLGDGTRDTGLRRVVVSPGGGPEQLALGLTWYPSR